MKVWILSMAHVNNMGSLLQCYCLKEMVEELGHSVEFLDIERREADDALLAGVGQEAFGEIQGGIGLLGKWRRLDRYLDSRIRGQLVLKRQERLMEAFRREYLPGASGTRCGCCIIGSDEVFNCLAPGWWGFTSQLFGDIPQAEKVITYGASCVSTVLAQVPEAARRRIRESFGNVCGFSVRDENTKRFVEALAGREGVCHLDPVLVQDLSAEAEGAVLPRDWPGRYCIVYSYHNRIHQREEIQAVRQFCSRQGLEMIGIGAPQFWLSRNEALSPFQTVKAFQRAAFVVTDTFHGTILAARYCGHFGVLVRQSNRNKLEDLLVRTGMEAHKVCAFEQLEDTYLLEDSRGKMKELLCLERERSMGYLAGQLNGEVW